MVLVPVALAAPSFNFIFPLTHQFVSESAHTPSCLILHALEKPETSLLVSMLSQATTPYRQTVVCREPGVLRSGIRRRDSDYHQEVVPYLLLDSLVIL
jgi:hypothetical protein